MITTTTIEEQIQEAVTEAKRVKLKCGYDDTVTANIHKLFYTHNNKFGIFFNYRKDAKVGDVHTNYDGTREEVLALV